MSSDCILWTGATTERGYGVRRFNGDLIYVHRWAWLMVFGELPPASLELDHICRNPACYNVCHLEAVTHQVNCQRGDAGVATRPNKTMCGNGIHPWTPEHYVDDTDGHRRCRSCRNERMRGRRRRAREDPEVVRRVHGDGLS